MHFHFLRKSWLSHYLLLIWLYFVKTIVNSLRQEYLHYGWEGVAKETWFYTINFSDCLNGLIRDMSNQLWVIIIIGKKKTWKQEPEVLPVRYIMSMKSCRPVRMWKIFLKSWKNAKRKKYRSFERVRNFKFLKNFFWPTFLHI